MAVERRSIDATCGLYVNSDILADELAPQIQAMTRGQYQILFGAIEAAGGSVSIDPAHFATESLRMPARIEVKPSENSIRLRLS